jgi:hypothetical protein
LHGKVTHPNCRQGKLGPARAASNILTWALASAYIFMPYWGETVDPETVLQQFSQLEQKIEGLIETCKQLEAANADLKHQKEQLAEQLQKKIDNERQHDELKGLIRSRIENLMSKLDGIAEE